MKKLTLLLIFSGALNIAFVSLTFYWFIKENPPTPYYEHKPAASTSLPSMTTGVSNGETIRQLRQLSLEQLVTKLSQTQLVEDGYTQRDLALAGLVSFYHFDLSRALLGQAQADQKRTIKYGVQANGKSAEIIVYPGLTEEQYQAIIRFANTERWPLTTRGLFSALKKQKGEQEQSLIDAFFLTPEFLSVEMLFNRSDVPIDKNEILSILSQGNWHMLSTFSEQQRHEQDLNPAKRQAFLLDYIKNNSKAAAGVFLKTDYEYAVKKLDDVHVLMILNLLDEKTPLIEQFSKALLTNPRSDAVWKAAAHHLGQQVPMKEIAPIAKEIVPNAIKKKIVAQVQVPTNAPVIVKATPVVPQRKDRLYIVQEKDSLWKISKRFKVDVDVLRQHNKLSNDHLKPGTPLRIPMPVSNL